MGDAASFGLLVLCLAAGVLAAVQSHRVSALVRLPASAFFLVAAIAGGGLLPAARVPDHRTVEHVVTLALVVLLFDGGLQVGWIRVRRVLPAVVSLGVLATLVTGAAAAAAGHLILGVGWYAAALLGTAVAPTDPAVVFSVLGERDVEGDTGTVLEAESGANDPVGIALMAVLVAAGGLTPGAALDVGVGFALQLSVGLAVGLAGGRALLWLTRVSTLPAGGLYPVRSLMAVAAVYGAAAVAHGSGLLAVFVAGIVLADEPAPFKAEVAGFHAALASLGEVVAFAFLGATVHPGVLARTDVWVPGLLLGLLVLVVIRPLVVLPLLARSRLRVGERVFVGLAGLKGAVPLLLGLLLLRAAVPAPERLYGVVAVVVLLSVVVQAPVVPLLARRCGIAMTRKPPPPGR